MLTSTTMRSKLLKPIWITLGIVFLIILWDIAANKANDSLIIMIPSPKDTLEVLCKLVQTKHYYLTVFYSFLRIIEGLLLGVLAGIVLGVVSYYVKPIWYVVSPAISIVRSTPVASIIVILWFLMKNKIFIPTLISFMMVCPIIWQSIVDAIGTRDKSLYEVATIFELSFKKRFKYIMLPQMSKYLVPAVITSIGLAWKSGIAAEIITLVGRSNYAIGQEISNSKATFDYADMFAWTISVIVLSLILESSIKFLLKKVNKYGAKT